MKLFRALICGLCVLGAFVNSNGQVPLELLKDINPGTGSCDAGYPFPDYKGWEWDTKNGITYFGARDEEHGHELWRTDGTTAGTYLVKDLFPGPDYGLEPYGGSRIQIFNDKVYFIGHDDVHHQQVWRSDGTAAGTKMLREMPQGITIRMVQVTNQLLIWAEGYPEIYVADETEEGMSLLTSLPGSFTIVDTVQHVLLLEVGPSDQWTSDLWRTDGTREGTYIVMGGISYVYPPGDIGVGRIGVFKEKYYFSNYGTGDIYSTDGTLAGTQWLTKIPAGHVAGLSIAADGHMYYNTLTYGPGPDLHVTGSLWRTDGASEPEMIAQFDDGLAVAATKVGNTVYFFVGYGNINRNLESEIWKTDGTPEGTTFLKTIGNSSLTPVPFTDFDGTLLFAGTDADHGTELWTSDGTIEGTHIWSELRPGSPSANVRDFNRLESGTYFVAADTLGNDQVWKLSAECGVIQLTNGDNEISTLAVVGDRLVVNASTPETGQEIFFYSSSSDHPCVATVSAVSEVSALSVYPNPVTDKKFYLKSEVPFTWRLLDSQGCDRLHGAGQSSPQLVDATDLPAGLYFVAAAQSKREFYIKVVIK